jgi:signal transduction histidine kinase
MEAGMTSKLADFIERHAQRIVDDAVAFARTLEVGVPLDEAELRDHLPEIIATVVADLRSPQTDADEIVKSEGRATAPEAGSRPAAATHALHRAHSGYSMSQLVSEYRALRAAVLRDWASTNDATLAEARNDVTRFNEAIDQAIAESVSHYASEVERWRNMFLGVLGHDLRSPLSAILMTSQMLGQMPLDAPVALAAQRLIRSGERMRELLDSLLAFNRAQLGVGFAIDRVDVDLTEVCKEEIELLQAAMPEARISFRGEGPVRGMFDAARIREALSNLVVNASKYGTPGQVIHVELRNAGNDVELAVANAGGQIPRESIEVMFEPLRRFAVAGEGLENASLGLGLFVVSEIAKAHEGTVEAESVEGVTTFKVRLPRNH